jgi:hypothetical protein
MDSYAHLVAYVGWPESGALMRRLDDGKHTQDGKPGNMFSTWGPTRLSGRKTWRCSRPGPAMTDGC